MGKIMATGTVIVLPVTIFALLVPGTWSAASRWVRRNDEPSIPLGINLSFCVKRWVTPALWAPIVREQFDLDLVQFSFRSRRSDLAGRSSQRLRQDIRQEAGRRHGISMHSAFIGLAHYTFNQLLHPDPRVRDVAEDWLRRAYRFAASAGIERVGGPLGAAASRADGVESGQHSGARLW